MSAVGFLIGAPRSGSGKTTFALGLMRALRNCGLRVAAAKCGPDYIDCAFHTAATGRDSVNLDSWAMPPELIDSLASAAATDADLLIAEASMGLFDGVPGETGRTGASADVAARLALPVVLLLDVSGQAQSAAAVAKGCAVYDQRLRVVGVVLNKVASERHRRLVAQAVEAIGLPVLGSLPRNAEIALPERHLGLVQAEETADLERKLAALGVFAAEHVDIERLIALAAAVSLPPSSLAAIALSPPGQRIAAARDAAFTFLYPHLLTGWRAAGAEVAYFSPLADQPPPEDADACWLPGGYPELHAGRLSAARTFQAGLKRFAEAKPVHGECGGYMTLGRALTDAAGVVHPMAGLLSVETSFFKRRMTLGYRRAELAETCALGLKGAALNGHEFHYATIVAAGEDAPFAYASDAYGAPPQPVGGRRGLVTGSFFHVVAEAR